MKNYAIINGPNLNMLGLREPEIYGAQTLGDIIASLSLIAKSKNCQITDFQANSEGAIVDFIHQIFRDKIDGVVINPGAYTHTSIAIRDALSILKCPIIEVHLSNIHKREEFRHHSFISSIAQAVIAGMGSSGYEYALNYLIDNNK